MTTTTTTTTSIESFTYQDALGLSHLPPPAAQAIGFVNALVVPTQAPKAAAFAEFDYETHVRTVLGFDLDPAKKGGGEGVCKFFLKGFCARGQLCPFKHVSQQTINANAGKAAVVCKHYLRGLCKKGDLCEFLHEYNLKKMPECWFFSKYQSCTNPECQYLHIDPNSKIKECPWYARGFCKHGPRCRNKHVRQAVCQNYVTGFCPKGPECTLGHPKFELPDLSNPDGAATGGNTFNPAFQKNVTCYKCKQTGHIAINCPNESVQQGGGMGQQGGFVKKDLSQVKCFKCQGMGHFANQCPNPPANPNVRFFRPYGGGGF
ncbi:hypothetical protein BCR33DRAFT_714568 [Rhizoclosmatium globosum]|uniref:mRNA 3'-end-processing protein n=1 Tax=Rhizoclosmatium globosum TaxID=329046 RepID=A0A1Y2CMA5_9FUNG|nr:hypothetical protein BCR33DRAFT_714568 [Rhizoclosmatium globosum]|eukprot:ORY48149.1 hypothetical protein BCR33DRAFT_714568 [Rhizoclosmatium globosum]